MRNILVGTVVDQTTTDVKGGTMTGPLYVSTVNPTQDLEIVNKSQIDESFTGKAVAGHRHDFSDLSGGSTISNKLQYIVGLTDKLQTVIDTKVNKTGDTMTGPLTLNHAPIQDSDLATKEYVDQAVTNMSVFPVGSVSLKLPTQNLTGYLRCDGSFKLKTQYSALYNLIGNSFELDNSLNPNSALYFQLPNRTTKDKTVAPLVSYIKT